ncbi:superoxide dismutase [Candidatus Woesearchaeota archaeon]|nr:superoxide dismutase [Candidatus Woesearchaeota archaeon]
MAYESINFDNLLGMKGFSDKLLQNHFKLYQGYVANTNKLIDTLKKMLDDGNTSSPEFAELKRRLGWEFNGMRLHELYFGNMSKENKEIGDDSPLYKKMLETFGTGQKCEDDFKAAGAMRGIGWVIMYYDKVADKLFNTWINEHDAGHFSGCIPLLVMDVFEHAFITDYGLDRKSYIEVFIKAIDWNAVARRFEAAKV